MSDTPNLTKLYREKTLAYVAFTEEDRDLTTERAEELAARIVIGRLPVVSKGRHPATVAKYLHTHSDAFKPRDIPFLDFSFDPEPEVKRFGFFRKLFALFGWDQS